MKSRLLLLLPLWVCGCRPGASGQQGTGAGQERLSAQGTTIAERFQPPPGYSRVRLVEGSYGYYLRNLPLKKHGSPVLYYNGSQKPNRGVYCGVVAMDIGRRDLQQCADAVMRLRAEYLYATREYDKIQFHFTNGFLAGYTQWRAGYRIAVSGNQVSWVKRSAPDSSYSTFRSYLEVVFSYAGTLSLSRELRQADYKSLAIGDVLIQGGSPGHAVVVVDVAENNRGGKLYLLAQSYMPAQEIQILCNPRNEDLSPWYEADTAEKVIETPEWRFTTDDLKRF
ncbi:MAG: DUF4846 domain-containing protein [Flavipsychrobacter sp.]|nr:DUF4846 domain-containing protein [Flavipsychrobacter sp.]